MQTKLYREQHGQIRRQLSLLQENSRLGNAERMRSLLAQLAGIAKVHLSIADKNLYPQLLTHADPIVRETAVEYHHSMGQVGRHFVAFYERWRHNGAIEADVEGFLAALDVVAHELNQRMDLEDTNLYNLLDHKVQLAAS